MGDIKQINIKNRTYFFLNYMIKIEDFNPDLVKIDKNSYKNIDIYCIGYITIKCISHHESTDSVNPLYFIVNEVDGFIEESNGKSI